MALEQVVSLAEKTWLPVSEGPGRFMQLSGIRFMWNEYETVGTHIVDVWVETSLEKWELLEMATTT
jgi:hypothetical protein